MVLTPDSFGHLTDWPSPRDATSTVVKKKSTEI